MILPSAEFFIALYFCVVNLIGFLLMGIDKLKAKRRAFRIPEAVLFWIAIIGGSIGSLVGMYVFRHKTRHLKFTIGMPVILFIQIVIILMIVLGPFFNIRYM